MHVVIVILLVGQLIWSYILMATLNDISDSLGVFIARIGSGLDDIKTKLDTVATQIANSGLPQKQLDAIAATLASAQTTIDQKISDVATEEAALITPTP